MKMLALQNCEMEGFGRYERLLSESGVRLTVVHTYCQEEIPDYDGYDAIWVGGTPISARVIGDHPFLRREREFLSRAIGEQVPCLGICFGAQLLCQLLGGTVTAAPDPEIGLYEVRVTAAGRGDPLLAGFPDRFPVFQWHADTLSVPAGGELLVCGEPCRDQMFRKGSVVGMLFHLEVSARAAAAWAAAYETELVAFGKTASELEQELTPHDGRMAGLSSLLIANLLKLVK